MILTADRFAATKTFAPFAASTMIDAAFATAVNPVTAPQTSDHTFSPDQYDNPALGTPEYAVQELWKKYERLLSPVERNICAGKILVEMTPKLKVMVRRLGVPTHLFDDGMGEARATLADCLMKFPASKKYGRVHFMAYAMPLIKTYVSRFREREMREESHRAPSMTRQGYEGEEGLITDASGHEIADNFDGYKQVDNVEITGQAIEICLSSPEIDDRTRQIFDLYFLEETSMYQIAQDLNLNPQIVTRCIARAIRVLKKHLLTAPVRTSVA